MKKQLLLILIFLPFLMLFPENFEFPDTDFMPGWEKSPSIRQFNESSLFNHINGAAELFNEFGFENLHVLRYAKGEEELTLETYRMVNSTAALGIYLMKCGRETPADSQTIRHTVNPFQVLAVRGEVFVQISNASGNPENQSVMLALLSKLAEQIPDSPPKPILDLLPSKNRISGTEKIIRGPYALEPVYTFGEGDVLQLSGKIFAVTGEYMNGGDRYKQILVSYPSVKHCLSVFTHIRDNLDPAYTVLSVTKYHFVFEDYKNEFASIAVESNRLRIQVDLEKRPPF